MWGRCNIENAPSGQDKTKRITFSEEFDEIPRVSVSCAGWLAIRAVFTNDTSKTGTTIGVQHVQGSTLNVGVDWIAIG